MDAYICELCSKKEKDYLSIKLFRILNWKLNNILISLDVRNAKSKIGSNSMNFQRNDLEAFGFEGFVKISHLKTNGCDIVPKQMGVYIVVNENPQKFNYLKKSIGGYFKDKDPTVSILELKNNWVDNAYVVYIGKAGGVTSNATLFKRINQYIQFGKGKKIGHRGGRYIWQLKDSDNLLFAWKPLIDEDPRFIELSLINEFTKRYNKMPFANLI